ncbi:hypothetical protein A6E12_12940 [Aliivibrio fischeri]|uniref:hypothetical protein n=1 Tax=Aliivibrio fischeri TaxID=668 RepID=UPI00080E5606|nr:hypothetical protein [Aliivibrio fischeri]OCH26514.1 hypothetical protein A6E12_12940 [Aliivibrio fischeri]
MAEVNEEILEQYLKVVKKWFYISDIPFSVPHNYSNIDVLGYDPSNECYYDFEVKFRSAFSLTNDGKSVRYLVDQFEKYRDQREAKIKEFVGDKKVIKVVVTTKKMFGISDHKRNSMEATFIAMMDELSYQSDIWYFDDLIPELVEHVEVKGRYNTQLLQTIRMLKMYQ